MLKNQEEINSLIYLHFKPNGKLSPYHFIRKYISPLIERGILKYKILEHKIVGIKKYIQIVNLKLYVYSKLY